MSARVLVRMKLAVGFCFPMVFSWGGVQAQEVATVEVGGGYGFLRDFQSEETVPVGWFASGAWNVTDALAIVGEVSGQHKRSDFESHLITTGGFPSAGELLCGFGPCPPIVIRSVRISGEKQQAMYTFVGGLRIGQHFRRVRPFVHFLVGATRVTFETEDHDRFVELGAPSNPGPLRHFATTETKPTVQVGGGVDIPVSARLSVRLAADVRGKWFGCEATQFRLSSGVVVGLGMR